MVFRHKGSRAGIIKIQIDDMARLTFYFYKKQGWVMRIYRILRIRKG